MLLIYLLARFWVLLREHRRAWPIPLGPLILAAAAFYTLYG